MSSEEFFMYLTIALIVLVPLSARLYRRLTMRRTAALLREQFGTDTTRSKSGPSNPAT